MEDNAVYFAERVRMECGVEAVLSWEQLEWFCWKRQGIRIVESHELPDLGVFLPHPFFLIVLQRGATEYVLAHELFHALLQAARGVSEIHAYGCGPAMEESQANRFAELLTGMTSPWHYAAQTP